jgi:hypothetical protein
VRPSSTRSLSERSHPRLGNWRIVYFFETLVRIHREGEGTPYTGLKPAGVGIEPAIAASDEALETGSVDALVKMVAAEAERGIRKRFAHAANAKKHMGESVERGRDYVAAYVAFMHYAERLHLDAVSNVLDAEHAPAQQTDLTPALTHVRWNDEDGRAAPRSGPPGFWRATATSR